MGVENVADLPPLDPAVVLIGTAKGGNVGPPSGLVDIGVSEAAYLFRVALPGIRKNECELPQFSLDMHVSHAGVYMNRYYCTGSSF